MTIPDNPFEQDRDQTSPSPSPRVLNSSTHSAPLSPPHRSTSPPILQIPAYRPYDGHTSESPMPMTAQATSSTLAPGGQTPGAAGVRTPRRVQWNNDSHIVTITPAPQEPPDSPSNTIDENNIDRVHAALERHQTRSSTGSRQTQTQNQRRPARPISTVSTASSAATVSTDDDYDYRLDVDPVPPLHTVTSQGSARVFDDDDPVMELLDNGTHDNVPEYINFGETDGLPNMANAVHDGGHSEATDLIRQHTGRWGGLRRRVRGAGAVSNAFGRRGSRAQGSIRQQQQPDTEKDAAARRSREDDFASRYPEEGEAPHNPLPGGGGASVLSSLLALYNQQQGLESGGTSAATSRTNSDEDDSSSDDDSPRADRIQRAAAQQVNQNSAFVNKGGRKESNESSPSGGTTPVRTTTNLTSRSAPSIVDRPQSPSSPGFMDQMKRYSNQIKDKDRPKAARSGAGVFGALVQNTNNLAGYAAPVNASLAPAATRPGYQLSRYSAPDVKDLNAPKVWRPTSRHSSRPGSVHSSTAVSTNGDMAGSPMKKALSTDDMMALRNRERETSADTTGTNGTNGTVATVVNGTTSVKSSHKFRPKNMTLDSLGKLPVSALKTGGSAILKGGSAVMNAERWVMSGGKTPLRTPDNEKGLLPDYFPRPMTEDERRRKEWEKEKKRRKKAKAARKKKEVFVSLDPYTQRPRFIRLETDVVL